MCVCVWVCGCGCVYVHVCVRVKCAPNFWGRIVYPFLLVSGCCFLCREPSIFILFLLILKSGAVCVCVCVFFASFLASFLFTVTLPGKSNLPIHLSRTRGLGWLRFWRGLLHREFVQLSRNPETALIWSRTLCSTSFCYLSFISFLLLL